MVSSLPLVPLTASYFAYAAVVGMSALGMPALASTPSRVLLATLLLALARVAWRGGAAQQEPPRLGSAVLERAGAVVWRLGLAITALNALLALLLPVGAYDALGYRLPAVSQWLDAGRVAWVQSDDALRNGYALGLEVLQALVTSATGSTAALDALALGFVLAGACALGALATTLGFPRGAARLAAGLFLLVPMHVLNGSSGYVDAAFAGACVACIVFCALWAFDSELQERSPQTQSLPSSRALLLGTGAASGWLIALKSHGVVFAALILVAAVLVRVTRRGLRATLGPAAALALLCVPGAFFSLRNLVIAHNPVYPVEIRVGDRVLFPGEGSLEAVLSTASNVPEVLRAMPAWLRPLYVWLQPQGPAIDFDARLAGLGYGFVLLALPASVWLCVRVVRQRRELGVHGFVLGFVVAMTLVCFAVQPLAFWSRYTSWLWGFGALALAGLVHVLSSDSASRVQQRIARVAALLAMTLVPLEASYALVHVKRIDRARDRAELFSDDAVRPLAQIAGMDAAFVREQLLGRYHVCRTPWRNGSDDANLDGVAAQLSPRASAHVVDERTLGAALAATRLAGCDQLIAIGDSPLAAEARVRGLRVRHRRAIGMVHVIDLPEAEQTL